MPTQVLNFKIMQHWLKPRPKTAHKGLFGHVFIIGGDYGMPGAVQLASHAAATMGAGLVTVITRPEHVSIVVGRRPEILCYGLKTSETSLLKSLLSKASFIVLGPGLGQSTWSKFLFDTTLTHIRAHHTPCLIDADGLNLLGKKKSIWRGDNTCIFTPHPGEAARLLQVTNTHIQKNRTEVIKTLQKNFGGIMVLKGHETLLYTPDAPLHICIAGNPGMASAGMGDLLSGLIAGFASQGLSPWQSAQAGVLLHATAGDIALKKQGGPGLLASDLLPEIKPLLKASKLV